ncbi:PHP domain-containing protein [Paenalcaligenes niemegkensis]|uniref:PHP domain-containing protein n=1 Tax=Paenalcaligenes niemegkensis TaxID=2895469 RepID=UPI0035697B6D
MPLTSALPNYAELHCLSNFSFLKAASHPHELVQRAHQLGYTALAITDECSVAGVVRAHVEASEIGLQLIIGASFRLQDSSLPVPLRLVLLAQNLEGYNNLCELISLGRQRVKKGDYLLHTTDISAPENPLLTAMPGCLAILLPEYCAKQAELQAQALWLKAHFEGRCWLGLNLQLRSRDAQHKQQLATVACQYQMPIVATGNVHMHVRSRKPLLDTLTAIAHTTTIALSATRRYANAELHLRTRVRLANIYAPEHLQESVVIAQRCNFSLTQIQYQYPYEICPENRNPHDYLREQTYIGARWRYPHGIPLHVQKLLEKELDLIQELKFEAYFLTVYDIVQFARQHQILCQGRGSAANSAVCYCLAITEVDPDQSSTLFERFISKERNEPPDIDVDFEHQRREEVIQYIYNKYGKDRAALTAVVISYRSKSALRDVGKALGIDPLIIDRVAKGHSYWDGREKVAQRMAEYGVDMTSAKSKQWLILSESLINFPRHLSQHPGGFVIGRESLKRLVPIENAAMPNRRIVQWDKDDLDALNFLKVDILALGMLSVIRRALDYVSERRKAPLHNRISNRKTSLPTA